MKITENKEQFGMKVYILFSVYICYYKKIYEENIVTLQSFCCWILMLFWHQH